MNCSPIHLFLRWTEEMEAHTPLAPEFITSTLAEEAYRLHLVVVHRIDTLHALDVPGYLVSINKGADKLSLVKQIHYLWRSIDEFGISLGQGIRRHPFDHDNRDINHG